MRLKFFRLVGFVVLFTFLSHQLTFAYPVQSGYSVIANIEQRHFVLVTAITGSCSTPTDQCLVTFLENGYTRTKTATEFQSQWFGVALVIDSVLQDTSLSTLYLNTKILKSNELLKVKGAGWFKKLFRKIIHFFQRVIDAVVNVIQKITSFITKALTVVLGKVIGGALAGIVNGFINLATAPIHIAYYASHGDWKGLGIKGTISPRDRFPE